MCEYYNVFIRYRPVDLLHKVAAVLNPNPLNVICRQFFSSDMRHYIHISCDMKINFY